MVRNLDLDNRLREEGTVLTPPDLKVLWDCLLTFEETNGRVAELSIRKIGFRTGLAWPSVDKALKRLRKMSLVKRVPGGVRRIGYGWAPERRVKIIYYALVDKEGLTRKKASQAGRASVTERRAVSSDDELPRPRATKEPFARPTAPGRAIAKVEIFRRNGLVVGGTLIIPKGQFLNTWRKKKVDPPWKGNLEYGGHLRLELSNSTDRLTLAPSTARRLGVDFSRYGHGIANVRGAPTKVRIIPKVFLWTGLSSPGAVSETIFLPLIYGLDPALARNRKQATEFEKSQNLLGADVLSRSSFDAEIEIGGRGVSWLKIELYKDNSGICYLERDDLPTESGAS